MADRYPPASVVAKLKRFDRELSLRWCDTCWGLYRRGSRIASVRHDLLGDGSVLLSKLHATDILRQHGSAEKAADFLDRTEANETKKRRDFRKAELIDQAKEDYDYIARRTGRRINNAGMPKETT